MELPSGTVTLVFTDIEGSTRILRALGDRYGEALADHRRLFRQAVSTNGGKEVDSEGDAFFCAFHRASDAVAAAAAAQRAFATHRWPDGAALRVRMGIHSGEPTPLEEGYVGIDLHRGARVMSAAHGGQILLSEATAALLGERLPQGLSLRRLGEHRLKDLTAPQRLYQLVIEGLEDRFPPLRTLENRLTNLPTQPTALVGREEELAEVTTILLRDDVRLLTLTGPGGTGKTRLALQLAAEVLEAFPAGVFFVGLAPVTEPALVLPAVMQTLGLREHQGQTPGETLRDYVQDRHLLLLLDNLERLLPVAPELSALLAETRGLKLLVTSRAVLRLAAEHVFEVPPLHEQDALTLFAARARAARPDFELNGSRDTVAEICRRLDRLPLAIELAAARIRALPPEQILERVDHRLKLLIGGARDLPERQQTLRATVGWSHDLLSAEEQALFRRLGLFAGGFSLESAEALAHPDGEPSLEVLDGLTSLIEKSLVRPGRQVAGDSRYWILETIREYALERLEESGEAEAARRRHLEYSVGLAEGSESDLRGPRAGVVFERLDAELGNFLANLTAPLGEGDIELRLRLLSALTEFWKDRGHAGEVRRLLDKELRSGAASPHIRAKALYAAGALANAQNDHSEAALFLEESIELFRGLGDGTGRALSLCQLSFAAGQGADYAQAMAYAEEALDLARAVRKPWLTCEALSYAAFALTEEEEDLERGEQLLDECVELSRSIGYKQRLGHALNDLACVALMKNEPERASQLLTESLAIDDDLGDLYYKTYVLGNLGWAWLEQNDSQRATTLFAEELALSARLGVTRNGAEALQGLAALAAAERRFARAAVLFAAGQTLLASTGASPWRMERAAWERHEPDIRAGLDKSDFDAAWREGQGMTLHEAATKALAEAVAISNDG
jgi:predicted ATPase/class 3 adenylate cyclase